MPDSSLPTHLRRYEAHIQLVKALVTEKALHPTQILAFTEGENLGIWVIIERADIDEEGKYGQIYFELVNQYPETNIDFLVLGQEELAAIGAPRNSIDIL